MTTVRQDFTGTEESFYAAVADVCGSCTSNIDAFAALNPKYTPAYVGAIEAAAVAASGMPNNHQRQGVSVAIRHALIVNNGVCCNNFSTLMHYTSYAFAPAILDARKKEAGSEVYKSAVREKWSATSALNTMMATFMDKYGSVLTAAGMPQDFPSACSGDATAFTAAYTNYTAYRKSAEDAAAAKTIANNAVYKSLLGVMKDGKFIFKNDELTRKRFVYKSVLDRLRKPGKTGFRVAVTNKITKEPIAKAHVSFTNSPTTGITDKKGVVKIEMPEGTFNYMISAIGYTTQVGTLSTQKNTMRHAKIEMTALTAEDITPHATPLIAKEKAAV